MLCAPRTLSTRLPIDEHDSVFSFLRSHKTLSLTPLGEIISQQECWESDRSIPSLTPHPPRQVETLRFFLSGVGVAVGRRPLLGLSRTASSRGESKGDGRGPSAVGLWKDTGGLRAQSGEVLRVSG